MYAEERQEKILAILKESRKIAVGEMSERFAVSNATVRADLRVLEEAGLITRTHGGALLRTKASFEVRSDLRETLNQPLKEQIGKRAAQLVEDGDIIILDTGTTTLQIARHIRHCRHLTVVTNDMVIAKTLEDVETIQILLMGGMVKKGYHCSIAIDGRSILDTLNVDKAFMGTNALSLKRGACVADVMLAQTKRIMVQHANQVIVVCDNSKLNNSSLAQFATVEEIDMVVIDKAPDNAEEYRNAGVSIVSITDRNNQKTS